MYNNEAIEHLLKKNNLWYSTNIYFFGNIKKVQESVSFSKENNRETVSTRTVEVNKKCIINLTENEILLIPIISTGVTSDFDVKKVINICKGDVQKVRVEKIGEYNYDLYVEQTSGEIVRISVNTIAGVGQRKNIVKFVETFRNEGAEKLFSQTFQSQNITPENVMGLFSSFWMAGNMIFIIFAIPIIIGIIYGITTTMSEFIDFDSFATVEVARTITTVLCMVVVGIVLIFVTLIISSLKTKRKIKKNIRHMTSFANMTQEQREEIREKRDEDIITSSGPIVSEDKSYGGIKRL